MIRVINEKKKFIITICLIIAKTFVISLYFRVDFISIRLFQFINSVSFFRNNCVFIFILEFSKQICKIHKKSPNPNKMACERFYNNLVFNLLIGNLLFLNQSCTMNKELVLIYRYVISWN